MTLKELVDIKENATNEEKKALDKMIEMALCIRKQRNLRKLYKKARRDLD